MGRRFSVCTTTLALFSASFIALGANAPAWADHYNPCLNVQNPTTIGQNKKCARVEHTVAGNVVNNATVGNANETRPGFFIGGNGSITGSLTNNGTIAGGGGDLGALTLGRNADVAGGIFNNGTIVSHYGNGIVLGYRDVWGNIHAAHMTGDIVNAGLIDGHNNGVAALYGTMSGTLINQANGTIKGGDVGVYIADTFTSWTGGIENHGLIEGDEAGIQIGAFGPAGVEFSGGILNTLGAKITAVDGPSILIGGKSFAGGIANAGLITQDLDASGGPYAGVGIVVGAKTVEGGLTNEATGVIEGKKGAAVWLTSRVETFEDGILNRGRIEGATDGVLIEADTFLGRLTNDTGATITGLSGWAVWITDDVSDFAGGIVNRGFIEGVDGAIIIESDTFGGGLLNAAAASILAHTGDAIFAGAAWSGAFDNRGSVSGAARGFAYEGSGFDGDVDNSGSIEGGDVAFFMNTALFDGTFTNSGDIDGGSTGVQLLLDQATGGFTNSGDINGDSDFGVAIDVGNWGSASARADIVNQAGGTITGGETGFWLQALNVFGDFINDGTISGGGNNSGIFIDVVHYVGDIVNTGALDAPSNVMHLVIGTLDGQVTNTGTITATGPNGVAVALQVGNGTTFTNEEGGLIVGDVLLGGPASYTFIGRDGGLAGDLTGNGDDHLVVEGGTHTFIDGLLAGLASFDVNDGGVAVMGAQFVGDPNGSGYGATSIDVLRVNDGGRLYLDDDTILHVSTFTQQAGGELTYYLVAPNGTPVAGSDYGRIDASGAVSLAGKLSVILDASSFGGTTETEFNYVDIIKGQSFSGDFDETEIIGSSYFFKLALSYGNTSLNLGVTRTPFDVTFCAAHLSQNSEDLGAALEAAFLAGGFTPEQIALFDFLGELQDVCGAYFDLGGAILGDINAITLETAGPWKNAVNDRVNSTGATSCVVAGSAGCLTRFAANEVGGSAVQSDANDPFAWLRTGVRPEGQLSVWGRILGVQGDNRGRGGAEGSDFTVTGGIAGADYVFTERFIAGVAAQWTTTDVDFKHRQDTADVQSFEIGGYFSYGDADFCINGNASMIFHEFDTYRFPFGATAHGAYEGQTISAYTEIGKVYEFGTLRVEPVLALSFAALDTDDYSETGTAGGTLLIVEGGSHRSLKSMTGARFAYPFTLESGRKIVPEARILWGHEYLDDQAQFRAALAALPNNKFNVHGQEFARDSVLAGVGLNVPLSSRAVLYADYDAALSRDQSVQSLSLGARLSW